MLTPSTKGMPLSEDLQDVDTWNRIYPVPCGVWDHLISCSLQVSTIHFIPMLSHEAQ